MPHRATLFPALARHAQQNGLAPDWLGIATGAFLRLDIPPIERTDECVLYTDADVLFLQQPNFFRSQPPTLFAASTKSTDRYDDMNSGVMLLNVPAMRAAHARLCICCRQPRLGVGPGGATGAFRQPLRSAGSFAELEALLGRQCRCLDHPLSRPQARLSPAVPTQRPSPERSELANPTVAGTRRLLDLFG